MSTYDLVLTKSRDLKLFIIMKRKSLRIGMIICLFLLTAANLKVISSSINCLFVEAAEPVLAPCHTFFTEPGQWTFIYCPKLTTVCVEVENATRAGENRFCYYNPPPPSGN